MTATPTRRPRESELVLHDPTQRAPIPTATMNQAAHVIDTSGLPALLELWENQDRTHAGGRPPYLTMRAILILWVVLGLEQQPMHITRVENILRKRLTSKTAVILGIALDPLAAPNAMYERARLSTNRALRLIDEYPNPNRHRRLTKAEFRDLLRDRDLNRDTLDQKGRRGLILFNGLLEATYRMLPERFRPEKISLVVDATRLRTHARGIGKGRLEKLGDDARISSEPDHGYYLRTSNGEPVPDAPKSERGSKKVRLSEYSIEAEFGVLTTNDASQPYALPNIVLGFAEHKPGVDPAGAARKMVDNLLERGHTIDHFVGDRAYMPNGDANVLQNFLRASGVKMVMDYPITALGRQEVKHGAILVDGNWYSPSLPDHLVWATRDYRRGLDALKKLTLTRPEREEREEALKTQWQALIAMRVPYRVRPKQGIDDNGRTPMTCPAAGNAPTVTCALRTLLGSRTPKPGLLPVTPPDYAPTKKSICSNKSSVTFSAEDGGKYEQYYQFGGTEWAAYYGHARSAVEAFNAYVKQEDTFALADRGRRRMRGRTAQMLLTVATLVAVNLQKIRDFLLELDEQDAERSLGITPPAARTRRSRKSSADTRLIQLARRRGLQPQLA